MNDDDYLPLFIVGPLFALLLLAMWCGVDNSRRWENECKRRGGHVHSIYKSTDLCIGADGRILEWESDQ